MMNPTEKTIAQLEAIANTLISSTNAQERALGATLKGVLGAWFTGDIEEACVFLAKFSEQQVRKYSNQN